MTERVLSQVQVSEMRFLRRIEGVTLFNKVRSSEIRKSLNIEPLLLRIKRSQLRWFGHVRERLKKDLSPNKLYLPKQMGEDQLDGIELDGPITLRILNGTALDFTQAKWWRWWKTVRCGGSISSYCPHNHRGKAGNKERIKKKNIKNDPD